jgi:adenine-specific DNA-methyltransferase
MKNHEKNRGGTMVKVKSLGQYFTPRIVARFMTNLIDKDVSAKALEPCAGKGVFLNALLEKRFKDITAYEIDRSLPNESPIEIKYRDFLSTRTDEKFDVIIGNPPYVRWKNIPLYLREKLRSGFYWQDKINGLSDLLYPFIYISVDKLKKGGELIFITPIFWTQTLHATKLRKHMYQQGELEMVITFNEMRVVKEVSTSFMIFKYLKKKTGTPIKIVRVWSKSQLTKQTLDKVSEILQRLKQGEEYIKEGEFEAYLQQQFKKGSPWKPVPSKVSAVLTSVEDACSKFSPLVDVEINGRTFHLTLSRLLEREDLVEFGISPKLCKQAKFAGKKYYILDWPGVELTNFIEGRSIPPVVFKKEVERYTRLGDVAEIGNGMVSGLDKAFKVTTPGNFFEKEKKKFIPVIKSSSLEQYFFKNVTPYIFVNDIENEKELKQNCPNVFKHLIKYKSKLENRYDYGRDIPWWHWVFPRNQELIESNYEKILTPCKERIDKKGYVRFAYANGPYYATQDVTVIVKKPYFKENVKYFLAILNSDVIFTWLRHKGLMRGGVLEFSEKPLSRIPVRLINWDDPEEVKIHEIIVQLIEKILHRRQINPYKEEIERQVQKLYGLSI